MLRILKKTSRPQTIILMTSTNTAKNMSDITLLYQDYVAL